MSATKGGRGVGRAPTNKYVPKKDLKKGGRGGPMDKTPKQLMSSKGKATSGSASRSQKFKQSSALPSNRKKQSHLDDDDVVDDDDFTDDGEDEPVGSTEGLGSEFEDEEIDEEEAFNTEDEEMFGHHFNRNSALRGGKNARYDDSDSDDYDSDEDDPNMIDLSDLIPDSSSVDTKLVSTNAKKDKVMKAGDVKPSKAPQSKSKSVSNHHDDDSNSDASDTIKVSSDESLTEGDSSENDDESDDDDGDDKQTKRSKQVYLQMLKQLDEEEASKKKLREDIRVDKKKTRLLKDSTAVALEDQETLGVDESEGALVSLGTMKALLSKKPANSDSDSDSDVGTLVSKKAAARQREINMTLGDSSGKLSLADVLSSLNTHDMNKGALKTASKSKSKSKSKSQDSDDSESDPESDEDSEEESSEEEETVDTSIPESAPIEVTKLSNELISSRKSSVSKPLATPLSEPQSERIQRKAATEVVDKDVSKWDAAVEAHRSATHLVFPLNEPKRHTISLASLGAKFGAANDLEEDLNALINAYGLTSQAQAQKEVEALNSQDLTKEEILERTARLRRMRAVLNAQELKNKRIAKIKSKTFHRIHRKIDDKHKLSLEELFEIDPEAAQKEVEKLEFERAKERARLTHSRAQSKWAKLQLRRGNNLDANTRQALQEQLQQSRELRKRARDANAGSDDDNLDLLSEDDGSDGAFEFEDEETKERRELEELRKEYGLSSEDGKVSSKDKKKSYLNMDDDEVDAEERSKPKALGKLSKDDSKGLFGLAFMKRALETERTQNMTMLREVDEMERLITEGVEDEETFRARLEKAGVNAPSTTTTTDNAVSSKSTSKGVTRIGAGQGKRAYVPTTAEMAKKDEDAIRSSTSVGSIIRSQKTRQHIAEEEEEEEERPLQGGLKSKGVLGGGSIFDVEGFDGADSSNELSEDESRTVLSGNKLTGDRLVANASALGIAVSDEVAKRNAAAAKRVQTALRVLNVASGGVIEEDTAALLESREAMKQFSGSNDANDFGGEDEETIAHNKRQPEDDGLGKKRSNISNRIEFDDNSDDESGDGFKNKKKLKKMQMEAVLASVDESEFQLNLDSDDDEDHIDRSKASKTQPASANPWSRDASISVRDEQVALRRATGEVAGGSVRRKFEYSGQAEDATSSMLNATKSAKGKLTSDLTSGLTSEVLIDTTSSALVVTAASKAPGQDEATGKKKGAEKASKSENLRAAEDEQWDGANDADGVDNLLASQKQQEALVARAFASPDHLRESFEKEKERLIEGTLPQEDPFVAGVPGWGSWGGEGVRKNKKQLLSESEKRAKHQAEIAAKRDTILKSRADSKLSHVIISTVKDAAALKYQVPMVPAPYQSREHFEQYMQGAVGKEWNTRRAVYRATKPEVVTRAGDIIEPMKWNKQFAALQAERGISAKGGKQLAARMQDRGGLNDADVFDEARETKSKAKQRAK